MEESLWYLNIWTCILSKGTVTYDSNSIPVNTQMLLAVFILTAI